MKLPITHQPFNIDVAVSLLQHREKLRCSIFVKSKVRFSCVRFVIGISSFIESMDRFVKYLENLDVLQQLRRELCILGLFVICVVSNIECGDRDVQFLAMLKYIHLEVQQSMELKPKFLNSCCYS
ncbi:hypothetical protein HanIR_Chr05g0239111 [Helianthus annuus]|nr:hypothetical protein HanIR_Chr05g0239111 [Helianthus annuus]